LSVQAGRWSEPAFRGGRAGAVECAEWTKPKRGLLALTAAMAGAAAGQAATRRVAGRRSAARHAQVGIAAQFASAVGALVRINAAAAKLARAMLMVCLAVLGAAALHTTAYEAAQKGTHTLVAGPSHTLRLAAGRAATEFTRVALRTTEDDMAKTRRESNGGKEFDRSIIYLSSIDHCPRRSDTPAVLQAMRCV